MTTKLLIASFLITIAVMLGSFKEESKPSIPCLVFRYVKTELMDSQHVRITAMINNGERDREIIIEGRFNDSGIELKSTVQNWYKNYYHTSTAFINLNR